MRTLGRSPNHDDNLQPTTLGSSYDWTAQAWKERYGVPYSVCGCMPDHDKSKPSGNRLSKIFGKDKKEERRNSGVIPNARPDLVSTDPNDADASHASEHPVNFGDPSSMEARKAVALRDLEVKACTATAKKEAANDPWKALQLQRQTSRTVYHREAFTDTSHSNYYKYWGVSMAIPFGCVLILGRVIIIPPFSSRFYGGLAYASVLSACGSGSWAACSACGGAGGCGGDGDGGGGGCGGCKYNDIALFDALLTRCFYRWRRMRWLWCEYLANCCFRVF